MQSILTPHWKISRVLWVFKVMMTSFSWNGAGGEVERLFGAIR